ncbi:MAG TPA: alpha/beta hydrolase [Mycobacteriales bacterium]|nr:alpha/beta hydrolase [Mycobacteriales bacterium]
MQSAPWPALAGRPLRVTTEDGVPLHVEAHGPDDAAGTVVLLHGYQLSQRLWGRQVDALRRAHPELRVLTYDHRGHGRSGRTHPDRATLAQLGRDLEAVLEQLVPDGSVVLVGHSMGGMTVMSYVEQHPHRLGSRVMGVGLLSTSSGLLAENDFGLHPRLAEVAHHVVPRALERVHRRVERGRRQPPSPATRVLLFGPGADRADVLRTQQVLDGTPAATSAHFYSTFADHDRLHALEHLSDVPVLVACGDRDRITPLAHSRALGEALPHAQLVVYPDAGHMLLLERAADVNRRLLALVAASGIATAPRPAALRAG